MPENVPTTPLLEWEAPSLHAPQRSARWYATAGSLVVTGAAFGFLSENWTFAVALLLLAGVYFLLRNAAPAPHRMQIQGDGFEVDGIFTAWKDCEAFWLLRLPTHAELHIRKKRGWDRDVRIQTAGIDLSLLRATLSPLLPEKSDERERLFDALIRLLKL